MPKLYIGNKNYSSWSMRPWVLMRQAGIAFEEVKVRFDSFASDSQFKRSLQGISPKNLFMIFSWGTLPRKGSGCKAPTANRTDVRRGWATPQTLPLRGNPKGMAANGHARRCPPCPGRQHGLRQAPRPWPFAAMRTP